MSNEGLKKGAKVAGKVVKWIIIAIVLIVVAVFAYSCYACSRVTSAVVDVVSDSPTVRDAVREATGGGTGNVANANPIPITIEDPLDIPFLHNDPRIEIGRSYEITVDAWFGMLSGTNVHINFETRPAGQGMAIETKSRIPDFQRGDPVRVVFIYSPRRFVEEASFMNSELVSIQRR